MLASSQAEPSSLKTKKTGPLIQEISSATLPPPAAASSAVAAEADSEERFTFTFLPEAKFVGFADKETQELLFKWGMQDHMRLQRYTYDRLLQPYQLDEFLLQFFNSPAVAGNFQVIGKADAWTGIGKVEIVKYDMVTTTVTTLDFFDRLKTEGDPCPPVREDGSIRKCLDEYVDGYVVSDELRKVLIVEESENYPMFSEDDRRELIFCIFKSLCLGGRLCQFEDELGAYLDTTKKLYKDLVSVTKRADGLHVSSIVVRVRQAGTRLFPMEHVGNWCYLSIDPLKRAVSVVYHASDAFYT